MMSIDGYVMMSPKRKFFGGWFILFELLIVMRVLPTIQFYVRNRCNATCYSLETLHWFPVNLCNIEVYSPFGCTCSFIRFSRLD